MPVVKHWSISALGRLLGSSGEKFSYSLNMTQSTFAEGGPFGGAFRTPGDNVFDGIAAKFVAFHGSSVTGISDNAVLETVKIASIATTGLYDSDPYVADVADTPGGYTGPLNEGILPQSALCISLVTERRGPSGKGRFYIPMPVANISPTTGLASVGQIENARNQAAALITGLNDEPGIDTLGLRVVVISSKGFKSDVTAVRVGRVIDTIRSRRAQLAEAYTAPVLI